jgi:hypothetical protein
MIVAVVDEGIEEGCWKEKAKVGDE